MSPDPTTYVNGYFAHQPIFDRSAKVWGYELFFRHDAQAEAALFTDEGLATMEVLANLAVNPDDSLNSSKLILNFSKDAIIAGIPQVLQPDQTVVEFQDPEEVEEDLLQRIRALKDDGYSISVRGYQARQNNSTLYDLADFLTVDIGAMPLDRIEELVTREKQNRKAFLAERVETYEQFEWAKEVGFSLFQGYFFRRPKTNVVRKITSSEVLRFKLLEQLGNPNEDFNSLSGTIKQDVSLSLRLLKLLNSPAYGLATNVTSIKQAAVYLGLTQLKHWLRVLILTDLKQPGLPLELTRAALQRAKFLELLSESMGLHQESEPLFLLGLFSHLDAMLDMPMSDIVDMLPSLDNSIRVTLAGEDTRYLHWLQLVESVEESDWIVTGQKTAVLHIDTANIMHCYTEARKWSNTVLSNI